MTFFDLPEKIWRLLCTVTAVAGLALGAAPNVAHYLPFLHPLSDHGDLASGLATTLAPAIGAALFTAIALIIIKCEQSQ